MIVPKLNRLPYKLPSKEKLSEKTPEEIYKMCYFYLEMAAADPLPLPDWWKSIRHMAGEDTEYFDVVLQCYPKESLPAELDDYLDMIIGHAERMDVAPPFLSGDKV